MLNYCKRLIGMITLDYSRRNIRLVMTISSLKVRKSFETKSETFLCSGEADSSNSCIVSRRGLSFFPCLTVKFYNSLVLRDNLVAADLHSLIYGRFFVTRRRLWSLRWRFDRPAFSRANIPPQWNKQLLHKFIVTDSFTSRVQLANQVVKCWLFINRTIYLQVNKQNNLINKNRGWL